MLDKICREERRGGFGAVLEEVAGDTAIDCVKRLS